MRSRVWASVVEEDGVQSLSLSRCAWEVESCCTVPNGTGACWRLNRCTKSEDGFGRIAREAQATVRITVCIYICDAASTVGEQSVCFEILLILLRLVMLEILNPSNVGCAGVLVDNLLTLRRKYLYNIINPCI